RVAQSGPAVNMDSDFEIVAMSFFGRGRDFVVRERLNVDHSSIGIEGAAEAGDLAAVFDVFRHVCLDQIDAVPCVFANEAASVGSGVEVRTVLHMRTAR